ncbi:tryptophan-rich sensory protein [Tardiphaga sp. 37S4]|uniref:TspO/MBR family protein n=1 Tax=unclassified Tardiphaga TaxID=2631404 RepID=UPI0008A7A674|nr:MULTISPECIES: TspO/MBR family protein [unclassified Tardiphaga]UFS76353.1 tryptophan-rich sensory protein [Tardiphaga sp. 37S4]SEI20641.1 TspO and MBR related proteins [Tardiphaga sp. OK245]
MNLTFSSTASLMCALAICFSVAALGAKVTVPEIPTWYATLAKPSWTPPRAAFPIVWPILYFLMAISVWLIWEAPPSSLRTLALAAFAIQLLLNAVWSPIFFGNHNLLAGLIVILLLVVAIAVTIATAIKVNYFAAALLLPYLAWILFAAALNGRIVSLN